MLYLFDIDGTLLWSGGAGSIALESVFFRHHGVRGAMAAVSASGKTDPIIVGEMFANTLARSPTEAEVETIISEYELELVAELERAPRFRVLPHVEGVLTELEADARSTMAVATGNTEAGAMAKLERASLTNYFACGGYGSDSAKRPELVAKAIERSEAHAGRRFDRSEIIVVGDTPLDVEAARACGVRAVAVATGHPSREELASSAPDAVIDELDELLAWHHGEFGVAAM